MKTNDKLSLVFNLLVVVMEVVALSMPMAEGIERLRYYTLLANYFSIIPCLLMVFFLLKKKSVSEVPFAVLVMKYIAAVALALTFIVVLVILIPSDYGLSDYINGFVKNDLEGAFLYWHLLCPILVFVSFMFFEGDRRLNKKKTIYYPCLVTLIYGFVMIILNITGVVVGPYPFLRVLYNPWYMSIIWFVIIGSVCYLIARYMLLVNQMHAPRVKLKR